MKALALVLVLAACGGGKDPVTPDPDAPVIPPDGPLPDLPPPRETKMSTVPMEVGEVIEAKMIGGAISRAIPENYSPASFLINTLLPRDNAYRTMDYVATILIE